MGRLLAALLTLAALTLSAAAAPVATVEGPRGTFTIDEVRLRAYLAAHPERSPRQGLQDLIDFELLAAEAAAAGMAADPAVAAAGDRAAVAAWLAGDFEPRWRAETLPDEMVRRSYEQNRGFFDHPQLRTGDHILVTTPDSKRPEDALDEAALALAERIAADLVADPPASGPEFRRRGQLYAEEARALGLEIKAQSLGKFARRGRYADEFEDAAFAIEAAGVPSAPFPSRFGWHIVRIDEIIPEKRQRFEEVEAELRVRIVPEVRQLEFLRLTEQLADALPPLRAGAEGVRALLDPLPLDAIAQRRGLTPADDPRPEAPPAPR